MEQNLFHTYFHVLLTGSHEKGHKGTCNTSVPRFAREVGMREAVVLGCLKKLSRKKLITINQNLTRRARVFRYSYELEIKPNLKRVVQD
jgi:transcription initiation factor IIE alpha subunit